MDDLNKRPDKSSTESVSDPDANRSIVRKRLIRNTLAAAAGNGWAMVVAVISLPVILDGLGRERFGLWVLVQTFSAVTGWLSLFDLGLGVAATRMISERAARGDHDGVNRAMTNVVTMFVTFGALFATAFALLGVWLLPTVFDVHGALAHDTRRAVLIFAVQIFLELITEGFESCLEGLQRVDLSRLADGVRRTAVAVAVCLVAQRGGDLAQVALVSAAATGTGFVVAVVGLRSRVVFRFRAVDMSECRTLLRYGVTIAVLRPLGVIHRTMDRLIVGVVLGPSAVAAVEVATSLQNGADAVLSATSYAVIPSTAWLNATEEHSALRQLLLKGTRYCLLVTGPAAGFIVVMSGPAIDVWIRHDRPSGAAGLAAVGALYILMAAPVQVGSNMLLGLGAAAVVLRAALIAVTVNLVLSIVLVHAVGVVGVFQATLIASAISMPLMVSAFLKRLELALGEFVRQAMLPGLVPSVVFSAALSMGLWLGSGALAKLLIGLVVAGPVLIAATYRVGFTNVERLKLRHRLSRSK